MHLTHKTIHSSMQDFQEVKALKDRAFPKNEQIPMKLLLLWARRSCARFTAYYDGSAFCGMTYTVQNREAVFVLYLAVNDRMRSKGYGSAILRELKALNPGKTILLNVEPADEAADNFPQRLRRINFYKKNGFYETGYRIADKRDNYDILSTSNKFSVSSYQDLLKQFSFGLYRPRVHRIRKGTYFREYREQDSAVLEDIVRMTWHYDALCSPKTAARLAKVYLSSCLANQTYTQVALIDGVPAGIIMARSIKQHRCPLYLRAKMTAAVISLYLSREGRAVAKLFGCVNGIDKDLLKQCGRNYQGELAFFAVNEKYRGKGIGRQLFQKASEYMRGQGISEFFLFTDTSCNYPFYEHQGMIRRGERDHTFRVKNQTGKMTFFIYDCICS
ncbi:GNAT family N-acetyltransferase [Lachnotalea sp. AF33-28]|uniref:GNAT family N-acetyltransferase n=1 Tax=Lachnotalea sp. AF33-28 TaxID=2292046 RepID=UPI000E502C0B|nr:GNAT family N-acetyltransferase [Lachnotalea sp. AF33-28]